MEIKRYKLEAIKMNTQAGLALLILDREEITTNAGQVGIRAEAFVEMIETGGIE